MGRCPGHDHVFMERRKAQRLAVPVYFQFFLKLYREPQRPDGILKRFGDLLCLPSIFDQTRDVHFGGCKTKVADVPQKGRDDIVEVFFNDLHEHFLPDIETRFLHFLDVREDKCSQVEDDILLKFQLVLFNMPREGLQGNVASSRFRDLDCSSSLLFSVLLPPNCGPLYP